MKNNLRTVLCITALLGAMAIIPANADDYVVNNGEVKSIDTNTSLSNSDVINNGEIQINSNSSFFDINNLENNNIIQNNSSQASGGIVAETVNNTGTIEGNGSLFIENGGTNTGSISQEILKISSGTLNNNGDITTTILNGAGDIKYSGTSSAGTLTINDASNYEGSINQNTVTVGNNLNIATGKSLTAETLDNRGTIEATSSSINIKDITNNTNIVLNNNSSLEVTNQTGTLNGQINSNGNNSLKINGSIGSTLNSNNGTLLLEEGNILESAKVSINSNGKLDINGTSSSVIIDNNDTWSGEILLNGGELTVQDRTSNGVLTANTGNLTISSGTLEIIDGSEIKDAVNTKINSGSNLSIKNGGKVTLNSGDEWNGTISLNGGTLDCSGFASNGTLQGNSGNLLAGNNNLNIGTGSIIKNAVKLQTSGNIDITGNGSVAIDNDDVLNTTTTISITDNGTLNYGKSTGSNINIQAESGNLNLLENSILTIGNTSSINENVALDLRKNSKLTLEGAELNLNNNDKWNGEINNIGGAINTNNVTHSSSTASLVQASGITNINNNSNITLGNNSSISGGNINITNNSVLNAINANITGGNMTIDNNSAFNLNSGNFDLTSLIATGNGTQNALINTMNGERNTSSIGELNITTQADFDIDIHARSNNYTSNDQFQLGILSGNGKAYVRDWSLNGDILGWDAPIDRHIKLGNIFMDNNGNAILNEDIAVTDKTTFTPIGWYQLNKNEEYNNIYDLNGQIIGRNLAGVNYTLDLVKYNPQVFRGQVATVAQWMNQLAIDDMLFTHSMVLPSFKEENGKMANNYASNNPLFAPYQYSIKDGGLWYKAYGTFEHLQMNQGLRVGNNSYGSLIGADFGLKELRNGWRFMPTAYIGYNGAHQYWSKMGQYQNGGQAGFMGTWYKNNLILSGLAYGGVYDNQMDVAGHSENTFNYFAGTAGKAAYNLRFHKDFALQPNLMVAYNFFGQQNWHSDFGQMGMMAGMLHGVNIAPGVNLIWEKDSFSTYLTLQYMYNVNGAVGGRAGNVSLPHVEMERGYIQYGIGFTKKFTDRASGYLQAVLRNVGRTGAGFQAGFNFKIGK